MTTVYSKPDCGQCVTTCKSLDKKGIDYEVVDMSTDPEAMEYVQSLGYMQAPVVVTETDHWSGFRPDKIDALAEELVGA